MISWLLEIFRTSEDKTRKKVLLNEDEEKQAKEAKEQTRRLLSDALKKKESLLVEDPKEFGDQKMEDDDWPLVTTDLVKDLIQELEKVTFAKNTNPEHDTNTIAYVYPGSEDRTIYLCALFWKSDPEFRSQQNTIIHEVSHFLGYGHTVQENRERVQKSPQSILCPLTANSVASALTLYMDHPGTYRDGSYSCCGETSRDTVCEKSWMAEKLRLLRAVNRLHRDISLLERDTDILVKTKIPLMKMAQDYSRVMVGSLADILEVQNSVMTFLTALLDMQVTLLIGKKTLLNLQTKTNVVKETMVDLQKTQTDLEETLDSIKETKAAIMETQAKILQQSESQRDHEMYNERASDCRG